MEATSYLREMCDFAQDILPVGPSYNTVHDGEFRIRYRLVDFYFRKRNGKLAGLESIVYGSGKKEEFWIGASDHVNPLFLLNSTEQHRLVETLQKF